MSYEFPKKCKINVIADDCQMFMGHPLVIWLLTGLVRLSQIYAMRHTAPSTTIGVWVEFFLPPKTVKLIEIQSIVYVESF